MNLRDLFRKKKPQPPGSCFIRGYGMTAEQRREAERRWEASDPLNTPVTIDADPAYTAIIGYGESWQGHANGQAIRLSDGARVVMPGESWESIAETSGVPLFLLRLYNAGIPGALHPGMAVEIPPMDFVGTLAYTNALAAAAANHLRAQAPRLVRHGSPTCPWCKRKVKPDAEECPRCGGPL